MMNSSRQLLGRWGENLAAEFLAGKGYSLIDKNVRTPFGEIDLIASQSIQTSECAKQQVVVFIEVKTRRSKTYGYPEAAINRRKKEHLLAAIQSYMQDHPGLSGDWRLDVIAIQVGRVDTDVQIVHFENAIS